MLHSRSWLVVLYIVCVSLNPKRLIYPSLPQVFNRFWITDILQNGEKWPCLHFWDFSVPSSDAGTQLSVWCPWQPIFNLGALSELEEMNVVQENWSCLNDCSLSVLILRRRSSRVRGDGHVLGDHRGWVPGVSVSWFCSIVSTEQGARDGIMSPLAGGTRCSSGAALCGWDRELVVLYPREPPVHRREVSGARNWDQ